MNRVNVALMCSSLSPRALISLGYVENDTYYPKALLSKRGYFGPDSFLDPESSFDYHADVVKASRIDQDDHKRVVR